jgi:hypothetical protein
MFDWLSKWWEELAFATPHHARCPYCGEERASAGTCVCCGADFDRGQPPVPRTGIIVRDSPRSGSSGRKFYVYFHRDVNGGIFYVGRGTSDRAWSQDRDRNWQKYVRERSNGKHTVELFKEQLTEAEACDLESWLISVHGKHLVNWINPGRQTDYTAIARYHELRDKNRLFVTQTRPLEKIDPEEAVRRYRLALDEMDRYEAIVTETGLIAELDGHRTFPDVVVLDRLTLCLVKLGRRDEARAAAEQFFQKYPHTVSLSLAKSIRKRVDRQSGIVGLRSRSSDD